MAPKADLLPEMTSAFSKEISSLSLFRALIRVFQQNWLRAVVRNEHAERPPNQVTDIRHPNFHRFKCLRLAAESAGEKDLGRRLSTSARSGRIPPDSGVALMSYGSFFTNGVA